MLSIFVTLPFVSAPSILQGSLHSVSQVDQLYGRLRRLDEPGPESVHCGSLPTTKQLDMSRGERATVKFINIAGPLCILNFCASFEPICLPTAVNHLVMSET